MTLAETWAVAVLIALSCLLARSKGAVDCPSCLTGSFSVDEAGLKEALKAMDADQLISWCTESGNTEVWSCLETTWDKKDDLLSWCGGGASASQPVRAYLFLCRRYQARITGDPACFQEKVKSCVTHYDPDACQSSCAAQGNQNIALGHQPNFDDPCNLHYATCLDATGKKSWSLTATELKSDELKTFCLDHGDSDPSSGVWACVLNRVGEDPNRPLETDDVGTWCIQSLGAVAKETNYKDLVMAARVYDTLCKLHLTEISQASDQDCLNSKWKSCVAHPEPQLCHEPCQDPGTIHIPGPPHPIHTPQTKKGTTTTTSTTTTTTTSDTTTTTTTSETTEETTTTTEKTTTTTSKPSEAVTVEPLPIWWDLAPASAAIPAFQLIATAALILLLS